MLWVHPDLCAHPTVLMLLVPCLGPWKHLCLYLLQASWPLLNSITSSLCQYQPAKQVGRLPAKKELGSKAHDTASNKYS